MCLLKEGKGGFDSEIDAFAGQFEKGGNCELPHPLAFLIFGVGIRG